MGPGEGLWPLKQCATLKQMTRKRMRASSSTTAAMMILTLKFCHHMCVRSFLPEDWNWLACGQRRGRAE